MTEPTLDSTRLRAWIGRQIDDQDMIDRRPLDLAASILPDYGDALGPFRHLFYFPDAQPLDALGRDGHPKRGGFLPPIALPRRMWAGGRLTITTPLRVGERVDRTTMISDITLKSGRSGALGIVTTRAVHSVDGAERLIDERDLVFREDPAPNAPPAPPPQISDRPDFSREITPSPTLLFRYSALMFNGHRIHYDLDYCREVEGYPHLVVHGPLIATLLADLAIEKSKGGRLSRFDYRALSPLTADRPFRIEGRALEPHQIALWARGPDDQLAMRATAIFS